MVLLQTALAVAEPYRRLVSIEWESIENAAQYEIELKPKDSVDKSFTFKSDKNSWRGRISSGYYMMRLRSIDSRGAPGFWNTPEEFTIPLETVQITQPKNMSQIQTSENETHEVKIEWAATGAADSYLLVIRDNSGNEVQRTELKDLKFNTRLKVAQTYQYQVTAKKVDGIESEDSPVQQITLLGEKLKKPQFQKVESEFVREIKWNPVDYAQNYDLIISQYDAKNKKWKIKNKIEDFDKSTFQFPLDWEGGVYRASVRAKAALRINSDVQQLKFNVRNGDRSIASEQVLTIRQSIERTRGWYSIASYLLTVIDYQSDLQDTLVNSGVQFSATGGTGRLGIGYLHPEKQWGFLTIGDLSGFDFQDRRTTYPSIEIHGVHRATLGDRFEFRTSAGLYYKELPDTRDSDFDDTFEYTNIKSAGPHVGTEIWYSLNSKFGMQFNARAYYSLIGINTPNGESLIPTVSTQYGLLGSYRIRKNLTGLAGMARRDDLMKYESTKSGLVNQTNVYGTYLNLFLEWAF